MHTPSASVRRARPARRSRAHALRMPAISLPDRPVQLLSLIAAGLVAVYIVLVVTTIFFAAWQTQLASRIDDAHASISALEDEYYAAIARIDATDPSALGLVAPDRVEYVVAARVPGLSFAGR